MSIRVSPLPLSHPPLPEWDCKGTTFFFPSKSFRNFFPTFFRAGHRRQARQTAEPPVWHAVARLRPQVGFFPVPEQKDCRLHRQANAHRKGHAQHGRSSLRSTGGTQPRDATATHMGKCWPDGECRPNIKKRPDRHSSQAPYHIRTSRSMYVITSCRPFRLPELQQVPSPESLQLRTQWSGTSRQLKPHSQGQLGKPW